MVLRLFSGNKLDFQGYRVNLLSIAQKCDKNNNPKFGLLGSVLSKLEYVAYVSYHTQSTIIEQHSFVEIPAPGPRPMVDVTSTADIALQKLLISEWVYCEQKYQAQVKAIDDLNQIILNSLPENIQRKVGHPKSGFLNYTSSMILQCLDEYYIVAQESDFLEAANVLAQPYTSSTTFEDIILQHRTVYDFLLFARQPKSEIDKVTNLMNALSHGSQFTSTIDFFKFSHPVQTSRTFDNLVQTLRDNRERFVQVVPAIGKLGAVAGAAVTVAEKKAKATPAEKAQKYTHYCWTHGPLCSHKSVDCRKKDPGHRDEATMDNICGGRTTAWVPKKAK